MKKMVPISRVCVCACAVSAADEICGAPRVQARAKNGDLLAVFSGARDEHVSRRQKMSGEDGNNN